MPLNDRWRRHCSHANDVNPTGLAGAIKKYGKENFSIRMIQACETKKELDEREIYWIKFYNTFYGEGYNRTLGGEGQPTLELPIEEIIRRYENGETMKQIADRFKCSDRTISNLLHANGIATKSRKGVYTEQQRLNLEKGRTGRPENFKDHIERLKKKIIQFDSNRNQVNEFDSLSEACRSLGKPTNHTNRLREAAEQGKFYWGYYWTLQ